MANDFDICLSSLREGDRDRYLCCLLTPEVHRGPIAALYTFNMELARIREAVSEPMLGEVRLQWWRDFLEGGSENEYDAPPHAAALRRIISDYDLTVATLINMIEARRFDLYDDPMPDRNTLEGYAGETTCAVIQLSLHILGSGSANRTADVAGHAGVAQLVAGLLLLMPAHTARGQLFVPADILRSANLDRDGFLTGADKIAVKQALNAFIAVGREHLQKARNASDSVTESGFAAMLPICLVEPVLDRAEKLGADVLKQAPVIAQWRRQIRLWSMGRKQLF